MKPPKIDDPHFMRQLARLVKAAKIRVGGPIVVEFAYDPDATDPEESWEVSVLHRGERQRRSPYATDSGIGAVVLAAQDFEKEPG